MNAEGVFLVNTRNNLSLGGRIMGCEKLGCKPPADQDQDGADGATSGAEYYALVVQAGHYVMVARGIIRGGIIRHGLEPLLLCAHQRWAR